MKRTATLLALLALAPLLMGGGFDPPDPNFVATHKLSGPAVSAWVVLEPTGPRAPQAAIRLEKGTASSGAVFSNQVIYALGCDQNDTLAQTVARFVWSEAADNRLEKWIPFEVLDKLFINGLSIAISPEMIPVFTDVDNAVCTTDPASVAPNNFLSFRGVVQFLIPKKKL